jgi:hypothetical protein
MKAHTTTSLPADVSAAAWVLFRLRGDNEVYGPARADSLHWGADGHVTHYQVLVPRNDADPREVFEADAKTYGMSLARHRESDLYVVHYVEFRWQGFLAAWRARC